MAYNFIDLFAGAGGLKNIGTVGCHLNLTTDFFSAQLVSVLFQEQALASCFVAKAFRILGDEYF